MPLTINLPISIPLLKKIIYFFVLVNIMPFMLAQTLAQSSTSAIWGSSSSTTIGEPLYNQSTWGVAPSQQTLNTIRNRNGLERPTNNAETMRYRNSDGNLLQTDAQGNIVRDANGIALIDSSALGQGSSTSMSADASGVPPPPPDDPVDVPIDGGVGILLMIGLGIGYKKSVPQAKTKKLQSAKICL